MDVYVINLVVNGINKPIGLKVVTAGGTKVLTLREKHLRPVYGSFYNDSNCAELAAELYDARADGHDPMYDDGACSIVVDSSARVAQDGLENQLFVDYVLAPNRIDHFDHMEGGL